MKSEHYIEANRIAWNEAAPFHRKSCFQRLREAFSKPGYSYLDAEETGILQTIGLEGKSVAQLCCNNGRELLSLKNLGAGRCVGFDISKEFIEEGRELNETAGLCCEFVVADVYRVPEEYDAQFDLVYVTVGALKLLPEMPAFFRTVARLLRRGGKLFIHEMHPILDMFDWNDKNDPPRIVHSYFHDDAFEHKEICNYWDMSLYASSPMYTFHHKMSDIISGCLENGLVLEVFKEYMDDRSNMYAGFERHRHRLPLSYALIARRT